MFENTWHDNKYELIAESWNCYVLPRNAIFFQILHVTQSDDVEVAR